MSIQIKLLLNEIPHHTLTSLGINRAVLMTTENGKVMITTDLNPENLREINGLEVLSETRQQEEVHSITMTVLKLDEQLMQEATEHVPNRYRLISELDTILKHNKDVYVAYVITHYNPQQKPCGPLTVNIGGDCYRNDDAIKDLTSILRRTKDLAKAMLKKSVMIFPDIPALHGGKKGEWIILNREGEKIDGISEEAIIALGSAIIPKGVLFLNRYKELQAKQMGICESFPQKNYMKPDSGSPDVLSGIFWRGDRKDKDINLCEAWAKRNVDLHGITCLPHNLGGTLDPSARPTGYGVATTAIELAKNYYSDRSIQELKFLIEAAGGVGRNAIESLTQIHGVPTKNITVFDRADAACKFMQERFPGIHTITLGHKDFYLWRLANDQIKYDVWINNGEGDNTTPQYIEQLIACGVRIFCGGANNFLEVATEKENLQKIFSAGGWAWPDSATSAGGWTLAVIDVMTRCQGQKSNTVEKQKQILDTITSRNTKLIQDVLATFPEQPSGQELWDRVEKLIQERVVKTLNLELSPEEIFQLADTSNWKLT